MNGDNGRSVPAENFSQDEVSNDDIASKNRKESKDVDVGNTAQSLNSRTWCPPRKHRAQAEGFTRINVAGEAAHENVKDTDNSYR
jgi:hypothetical protein